MSAFKRVSNLPLFTWLITLIDGYNKENMNIDDTAIKHTSISKQLTMMSNERNKTESEKLGFSSKEHDSMQEFFNKELKKTDAKEVLVTI